MGNSPLSRFFMKQSGLLLIFTFLFVSAFTQRNISFNLETGIDALEQQYVDSWKKIRKIDGFRIQITTFSGVNSRVLIENTAEQFKQQFPDTPFYITYFEPNYRLRTGNYLTKLEAYNALRFIAPLFPGSFVVKDLVDFKN